MDYFKITDLLSKFTKIISDSDSKKEIVISVLLKYLKKTIPKENFKIDKNILVINMSPLVKNEIFIHKLNILKDLESVGMNIKDIR